MDSGLYTGNYYDYKDDDVAIQREFDIIENIGKGNLFDDTTFSPDTRSLYFDPLYPPKNSVPGSSIKWERVLNRNIINCDNPETFKASRTSAHIVQGAVGDSYFINAIRLLACHREYLSRIIVSDKYASQGLYTFKFSKLGKWRYVHIDDTIPCRPSGKVNFCRNVDSNEVFAMLLEKAYAKLYGCYEALIFGFIEQSLSDFFPGCYIRTIRSEDLMDENACDILWDVIESAMLEKKLVGCGRFISNPYGENVRDRQGLAINYMYEIVDAAAVSAGANDNFDAITVGMICLRNLQQVCISD